VPELQYLTNLLISLSAIMLSRIEMDVDTALQQYDMVGDQVFAKPRLLHASIKGANAIRPKYPSRYMEKAIQGVISQCLKPELELHGTLSQDVAFASNPARCRASVLPRAINSIVFLTT
jgi:hypothetical protein